MLVHTFYFNPIRVCSYVMYDNDTRDAVFVDMGCYDQQERERLLRFCQDNSLRPVAHLLTHAHLDHIFGAKFVYDQWGLLPYLNEKDGELFCNLPLQAHFFGIPFDDSTLDKYTPITDNQTLGFGFARIETISTPGHTEGGVCFLASDIKATTATTLDDCWHGFNRDMQLDRCLFSGDTLFAAGIGRTDLPGGSYETLIHSIQNRLFSLDDNLIVLPGHGMPTTIGQEKHGMAQW